MNGKQRVTAAIAHKTSDRFPLSYEATYEVSESLIEKLGIDEIAGDEAARSSSNQPSAGERKYGWAHEFELQRRLGVDQAIVICPTASDKTVGNWWGLPLLEQLEEGKYLGAWGIKFRAFDYEYGTYIEIDSSPLQNVDDYQVLAKHPTPSLDLWDYQGLKEIFPRYSDLFVWLNMNGCFDFARFTRGTEPFLTDLALEPKKAEVLLDKVNQLAIDFFNECMKHVEGQVDGVYLGDDFGTQLGLLLSPEMWRQFIKPRYRELLSVIKSRGIKYCHHSCGGIRPIIPDLIEIGVDVLNPIQPLAKGMDPEELGAEYGRDLCFYGGIDEQRTLPAGSRGDVKEEVRRRIDTLGKHGGYIVAPSHAFQPDTPLENVLAVYEEVLGYTPH